MQKRTASIMIGLIVLFLNSGSLALAIPTIEVLSQNYMARALVSGGPLDEQSSSIGPVTASSSTPPPKFPNPSFGTAQATAYGSMAPYGGFLGTSVGLFFNLAQGFGEATATMDFLVTEPLVFYMHSYSFFSFGGGTISLVNVTDNVPVVIRGFGQNGPFERFDSPLLEVAKQYRLSSNASIGGAASDAGYVRVDVNVPEPSSFWLLLPALGLLGLVKGH